MTLKQKAKKTFNHAVFINMQAMEENVLLYETIASAACLVFAALYIFKHLNVSVFIQAFIIILISRGILPLILQKMKEYLYIFKKNLKELKEYRKNN